MGRTVDPNTPPDSLGTISEKLQLLSERVAMGRLDGVVLLVANLVTFLTGALATWLPSVLASATGQAAGLFSAFGWMVVIILITGVATYILAYLRDDLSDRWMGLLFFIGAGGMLTIEGYIWIVAIFIVNPSLKCGLPGYSLSFLMTLLLIPAVVVLSTSIVRRSVRGYKKWLRENIPHRWSINERNFRSVPFETTERFDYDLNPRCLLVASIAVIVVLALASSVLICGVLSRSFDFPEYGMLLVLITGLVMVVQRFRFLASKGQKERHRNGH